MLKRLQIVVIASILTMTAAYGQNLPYACQGSTESYMVKGLNGQSSFSWRITDPKGNDVPTSSYQFINAGGDSIRVSWNFPDMAGGIYTFHIKETSPWGCIGEEYTQDIVVNTPTVYLPISKFTNVNDNLVDICSGGTFEVEVGLTDGSRKIATDLSRWMDLQQAFDVKRIISAAGTFTVKVVDDLSSCSFDTVKVVSHELPTVSLGDDFSLCDNLSQTIYPNVSADAKYYTWQQDGQPAGTGSTFTVTSAPSNIILSVETSWGCKNSDTLDVKACDINSVRIPAAFTPNGDGVNDRWEIPDFESKYNIDNLSIEVYNRWGKLMYKFAKGKYDKSKMWDGRDPNGSPLPVDSYHYVLRFEYRGNPVRLVGPVTILL